MMYICCVCLILEKDLLQRIVLDKKKYHMIFILKVSFLVLQRGKAKLNRIYDILSVFNEVVGIYMYNKIIKCYQI